MKTRRPMLLGALTIGLAAAPQVMAAGIPLPVGNFSFTAQGTEASCSGSPPSCVVLNIIEAGGMVHDRAGNACGTHTAVVNTAPPSTAPPIVVPSITTVLKVTQYDPNTGTGDASLNEYVGGSCNGAIFNSTGATQVVSGALHFTVSGGNRIDSVLTALNIAGLGGFSITFTELAQSAGNTQ